MERLMIEHLPPVLRRVRDFQCLMGAYEGELSLLWRLERETEDNFYLFTADGRGLAHWENILGIVPREDSDLAVRRQVVAARLGQTTPYDWRTFLVFMTALTGSEEAYTAALSGLTLEVRLKPAWRKLWAAVWEMMLCVVPANVETRVIRVYSTHRDLGAMTHGGMGAYTHRQLRTEVEV